MSKARKSWNKITPKEFENTRLLHQAGLSNKKISEITGRHHLTVGNMLKSETIEEYHQQVKDTHNKYLASKAIEQSYYTPIKQLFEEPKDESEPIDAAQLEEKIDKILENVLFIAEHMEVKIKKRFF